MQFEGFVSLLPRARRGGDQDSKPFLPRHKPLCGSNIDALKLNINACWEYSVQNRSTLSSNEEHNNGKRQILFSIKRTGSCSFGFLVTLKFCANIVFATTLENILSESKGRSVVDQTLFISTVHENEPYMRHCIARRMNSILLHQKQGVCLDMDMRSCDRFKCRPRTSSTVVVQAKAKGQGDMTGQKKGSRAPRGHKRNVSSTPAAMVGEICVPDATPVAHVLTSRYRALVLDASYRPIDVVNWQRAIVLDLLQKADVLEYYDYTVNSVSEQFFVPAVIKAKRCGKHLGRFGRVPLNRRNIMLRDGLKCQYCGKKGGSNLTLDHVIPQSKGGPNTWQNLVTACGPCNTKKGDSTLRQLRWKLLSQPKEPSPWDMGIILASLGMNNLESVPEEWSTYLFSSGSDTD